MNVPRVNTGTAWASPRRFQALAIALAVTVLALFPLVSDNAYYQNMAIMAFLLAVMASGWNIISGYTGYISLGQSAFLGIGAYTTACRAGDARTTGSPVRSRRPVSSPG